LALTKEDYWSEEGRKCLDSPSRFWLTGFSAIVAVYYLLVVFRCVATRMRYWNIRSLRSLHSFMLELLTAFPVWVIYKKRILLAPVNSSIKQLVYNVTSRHCDISRKPAGYYIKSTVEACKTHRGSVPDGLQPTVLFIRLIL
jgi:hypothetical protein